MHAPLSHSYDVAQRSPAVRRGMQRCPRFVDTQAWACPHSASPLQLFVQTPNSSPSADAFRLLSGKEDAREYGFREDSDNHHVFCGHCGVRLYTYGHVEQIGGDYVSVALSALDDLSAAELTAAPVRFTNGREDDWFHVPAETRHL
jgi:hypothetical protein